MDYSLAALKLFCFQLKHAQPTDDSSSSASPTATTMSLYDIHFQRAWVQGVLVRGPLEEDGVKRAVLDDGTDVVELLLSGDFQNQGWEEGMYVMAVGMFVPCVDGISKIKVHKIVDLSSFPYREAMWHLEVIEAFKLFYESAV